MARILIPDCLAQSAYAAIRALARAGDRCEVAWNYGPARRLGMGRFLQRIHRIESAQRDPAAYAADVLALCRREHFDVVMPLHFDSVTALVPHRRELLETTRVLLPTAEQFSIANDKLRTARYCEARGIECPTVLAPITGEELGDLAGDLRFPVVLKRRSAAGVEHGLRFARSREELLRARDELSGAGGDAALMLQEFVPGDIHDVCLLARDGEVLQLLTQVRKLMYPVSKGVGAVNFTTHNAPIAAIARKLAASLRWNGPAQIEFKLDARDGHFKLIEMNPKFWGTLDLSNAAGVPFPVLLRDLLLDGTVRERSYAAGVRYRFWFDRAVPAYWQLARRAEWRATRDPQAYAATFCDFDPRDPVPDLLRAARSLVGFACGRSVPCDPGFPGDAIASMSRTLPVTW